MLCTCVPLRNVLRTFAELSCTDQNHHQACDASYCEESLAKDAKKKNKKKKKKKLARADGEVLRFDFFL